MKRNIRLALILGMLPIASSFAQVTRTEHTLGLDANSKPTAASIDALDWLAGHWRGSAMGGTAEEIWSPAQGGEMIGMFRLVQNDKPTFYEFMTISTVGDSLALRIKHFDSAFKGWEAQDKFVEFKFVKQDGSTAFFDGLTFAPKDDGGLTVFVAEENDGKYRELRFDFARVAPALSPGKSATQSSPSR